MVALPCWALSSCGAPHSARTPRADELVYHEEDEAFYMTLSRSRSNKLLLLDIGARLRLTSCSSPYSKPHGCAPAAQGILLPALPHGFPCLNKSSDLYTSLLRSHFSLFDKHARVSVACLAHLLWRTLCPVQRFRKRHTRLRLLRPGSMITSPACNARQAGPSRARPVGISHS